MTVEVHLYSQSNPVVINDVRNCYTKDSLYCIMGKDLVVYKFPIEHIFRIKEIPNSPEYPF